MKAPLCPPCAEESNRWLHATPQQLFPAHALAVQAHAAYDLTAAGMADRRHARWIRWRNLVRSQRRLIADRCRSHDHAAPPKPQARALRPRRVHTQHVDLLAATAVSRLPRLETRMITHIAGQHITIDDRYLRQRCAWCGAILLDYDLERVAAPIGQEGPPATWPAGALVTVDGGASWTVEVERLPDDSCTRQPDVGTKPRDRCGARGMAGHPVRGDLVPGCIRRPGHPGEHGYADGSGEQDPFPWARPS